MYDFEGDTENGELVINEGEEVIVLNQVSFILFNAHSAQLSAGLYPNKYGNVVLLAIGTAMLLMQCISLVSVL